MAALIHKTDVKVEQGELKVAYYCAKAADVACSWEDANMAVIRVRRYVPRGGAEDAQNFYEAMREYFLN